MQNIHSHSVYCDGRNTVEEMALAAIDMGCDTFGFSGHSHAAFDAKHSMSPGDTKNYIADVERLRERLADRIELFLGVEQEGYSDADTSGYDFVIGAVHYVKKDGEYICIDNGPDRQQASVDKHFGGDYLERAELYFQTVAETVTKIRPDVVAHFDLVTKYNFDGSLFDESHPRYVDAALGAMDEVLKSCKLFEINTGAMFRFGKPEPYPSEFLLRELRRRGGEVIFSSDSHSTDSICFGYDKMRDLAKSCGFSYYKRLTRGGFVDEKL